ncbi:methyltransferase domain-containing protein, partial [Nonomuraea sp. RK-328]|nr:methyltransferase domain-containing protein [Nonomuraea sp. RK-328]
MSDFEERLVDALQPARYFFLAQTIEYGLRSGVLSALAEAPGRPLTQVATSLGMDTGRLGGLLRYWSAEGLVIEPDSPALTRKGSDVLDFRPWHELLLGGYGRTLDELPAVMRDGTAYASRDGAMVGKGSCGISQYDAIPLLRKLFEHMAEPDPILIDLGCGDGTVLLDLCGDTRRGIGIDPVDANVASARALAVARNRAHDVRFDVGTAEDYAFAEAGTVPCFIAAFSLQEVLEQRGRSVVVSLVRRLLGHPGAYLAVVEVDYDPAVVQGHGLGMAYYNPYYLLHEITNQRLETTDFWTGLFAEAGTQVVTRLTTDPEVDSTGLEIGFLLRSA